MRLPKRQNPLEVLSEGDFQKLKRLEEARELDFQTAVEILGLDPKTDFRYADLSGVSLADADLSDFDLHGANLFGCSLDGTILPKPLATSTHTPTTSWAFGTSQIVSLDISQDGKLAVVCDADGQIGICDVATQVAIALFKPPGYFPIRVGFLNGDKHYFAASSHGLVRVFNTNDGSIFTNHYSKAGTVLDVGSFNGRALALVARPDGTATLHDIEQREIVMQLVDPSSSFTVGELNLEHKLAMTVSKDAVLRVWDLSTGEAQAELDLYGPGQFSASLGKTEAWFHVSGQDRLSKFYSLSGELIDVEVEPDTSGAWSSALFKSGITLYQLGSGVIHIYDMKHRVRIFQYEFPFHVTSYCVRSDTLIVGGSAGEIDTMDVWLLYP